MAIALSNFLPNTSQGSLASVPPWQRILMQAGANSTWIDKLNQSLISDLSPGLRVGAFICPTRGDMFTQWINHVPCMIKANLPVYIYWPTYSDDYAVVWDKIVAEFPCLLKALEKKETTDARKRCLARQAEAAKYKRPMRSSHTPVFLWVTVGDIDPTVHYTLFSRPYRLLVGHSCTAELWEQYPDEAKYYDPWRNEWDIHGEQNDNPLDAIDEDKYADLPHIPPHVPLPPVAPHSDSFTYDLSHELRAFYPQVSDAVSFSPSFDSNIDIFRYRYGLLLGEVPVAELSPNSIWLEFQPELIWKHFSFGSNRPIVDYPQYMVSAFLTVMLENAPAPNSFQQLRDLDAMSPAYLGVALNMSPTLKITEWEINDLLCYAIHYKDESLCWFNLLIGATTALELCRCLALRAQGDVIDHLASRGIAF
ncbi:hypothetical protein C8Q79DRAFT_1015331 [Trametes meyenii]|nr:hypothetical protein C8Q79DRAFT_1015331 [Trametes meyenii]